jgi:hypothetical protein
LLRAEVVQIEQIAEKPSRALSDHDGVWVGNALQPRLRPSDIQPATEARGAFFRCGGYLTPARLAQTDERASENFSESFSTHLSG